MGKVKYLQFELSPEQYHRLKLLMDEMELDKAEFVALLSNHVDDLRKLFSNRKKLGKWKEVE